MNKKMISVIAAGAAAVLMLSGFDSAMTAEDIQSNTAEAMKGISQVTMQMTGIIDASMNVVQNGENGAEMTVPVTGQIEAEYAACLEPLQAYGQVAFSGSALGQSGEGAMEMYMVSNDDGTGNAYVNVTLNGEGEGWQASEISTEDMAMMQEAVETLRTQGTEGFLDAYTTEDSGLDAEQLKALVSSWTDRISAQVELSPEPADINGRECYELITSLDGDAIAGMVSDAAQVSGQELDGDTLQMIQMIVSGLVVNGASYFDTQTYLPVAGKADLEGSDFSMLSMLAASAFGGEGSMNITANQIGLEYTADYDTPVEITVPEEALAAPVGEPFETEFMLDGPDSYADQVKINEDGSYHLEETDYNGVTTAVDVMLPEGMEESYASESYLGIRDEDYLISVSYSVWPYSDVDEAMEFSLDTEYLESDEDYSDISVTGPDELTLDNGITVKYGTLSYLYDGDYLMSTTHVAIPAGDGASVRIEIEKKDENYRSIEVTEEDIREFAGAVALAG